MSITADQFTAPLAYHGEGPIWHPSWPGLRFVDVLAGDLVSLNADSRQVDRLHLGTVAAAFRPRRGGGTVAAVERGFVLIDPDGAMHHLPELWDDVSIRMNEADVIHRDGSTAARWRTTSPSPTGACSGLTRTARRTWWWPM